MMLVTKAIMKTIGLIMICISSITEAISQQVASFKTSDGEILYYTKTGKGPRIILLYGAPGYGASIMQPWADTLSNQFECILFEQRGTGLSSDVRLDSTTINLKRAAMDIEDLRKHLGNDPLTICGISWGGALAQLYASFYPRNVKKMVLVSTLGPDLSLIPAFTDNIKMRRYPAETDSLTFWNKQPDSKETHVKRNVFFYLSYFYDHSIGYTILPQVFSKATYNSVMGELMWKDVTKNYDLTSRLKNYKGKCSVIRPRQDVIPEEASFQIKNILPQAELFVIEKCGHFPDWEKPKEFYTILRKVLM